MIVPHATLINIPVFQKLKNIWILHVKKYILERRDGQLGNGRDLLITRSNQNPMQSNFRCGSSTIVDEL